MFVSSSQNKNIYVNFIGRVVRVKYDNFCKTFGLAEIAEITIAFHFFLGKQYSPKLLWSELWPHAYVLAKKFNQTCYV